MTDQQQHQHDEDTEDTEDIEDHDRGLGFDLETLRTRRAVFGLLGAGAGLGAAGLAGATLLGGSGAAAASSSAAACSVEIPTETAGPYPGDGSNGPDVLSESGIVRRDIRRSFGASTTKAAGVPFRMTFTLVDTSTCKPIRGLALYAWHANRDGHYSMYDDDVVDENYLRGVQVSGAKGKVRFTSVFPGCYSGRWPHVHFEVYRNKYAATHGRTPLVTSQLAIPRKPAMTVYRNATGYSTSVTNLERTSLSSDMVFGDDGGTRQLATVTGSIAEGYDAKLYVPVDV